MSTVELATKDEVDALRGQLEALQEGRTFGKAILSGNGSAVAFTLKHNLESLPGQIQATAGSPDAANRFYMTAQEETITVTFIAAPPTGSGNIVIYWEASL